MGRKVHPIGFRLGINKPWLGRWYAEGKDYTDQLHQDLKIRELVKKEAERAGVSTIEIERYPGKVKVTLQTAKPGILIGRKGESVKVLRHGFKNRICHCFFLGRGKLFLDGLFLVKVITLSPENIKSKKSDVCAIINMTACVNG